VWVGASSLCPDRELEGRIDEVAILARALSIEEVAAMFEAGNPYSTCSNKSDNNR
jgi:hypothetical protein